MWFAKTREYRRISASLKSQCSNGNINLFILHHKLNKFSLNPLQVIKEEPLPCLKNLISARFYSGIRFEIPIDCQYIKFLLRHLTMTIASVKRFEKPKKKYTEKAAGALLWKCLAQPYFYLDVSQKVLLHRATDRRNLEPTKLEIKKR